MYEINADLALISFAKHVFAHFIKLCGCFFPAFDSPTGHRVNPQTTVQSATSTRSTLIHVHIIFYRIILPIFIDISFLMISYDIIDY